MWAEIMIARFVKTGQEFIKLLNISIIERAGIKKEFH